jgi:hypothetical protein
MKNLRYANPQHIGILFDNDDETGCVYVDSGEVYNKAIAGEYGDIAEYQEPTPTDSATLALFATEAYKRNRAAEYPDFKDYLDGIVKGDTAQVQAYIDACNAVKTKYPKG